ncbi:hypothetical protein [Peribacillus alkalitolerans]|uniref:hypothetical protein n=1 Tax=Peribacillus alkalitolerans TaxID=1550385 RepID=UPI001967FC61|nr:hypothetical protein [Peribacillus alkalitolerans]
MDIIKIIFAGIIFLYAIYSIFRSIRHSKELKKALKENRLKTYSGKVDREYKRTIIEVIILIILSTLYHLLF